MNNTENISYSQELLRKGIHMISLLIPVCYSFLDRRTALLIILPLTAAAIIIDVLMKRKNRVRDFIYVVFGKMLRPHEKGYFVLNGASWVLISAFVCILIFPKIITITAFSILIISDISAALIGRKFGRHRLFDKSVEGTLAFIVSAILTSVIIGLIFSLPPIFYYLAVPGSIIGGIVEAASNKLKIDDNLSIPLSIGFFMWMGAIISQHYGFAPFLFILH